MEIKRACESMLFVGGDMRQIRAANRIAEYGYSVSILGFSATDKEKFSERIRRLDNLDEVDKNFDAVVLPLPYTIDGENINTNPDGQKITTGELVKKLSPETVVLGGKCDRKIIKIAEQRGLNVVDYFDREDLQILNAIPTAEGAIQIAMEEVKHTIHSSKCLVIGNGRIGKILSKMLDGMGAEVTVAARKNRDRVQAFAAGLKSIPICSLYEEIGSFDIIFNTAPSLILDSDLLVKTRRDTVIIDLASSPGGVDFESARRIGIKVIWALSLPGKVAPDTAGDIIGKTILNILDELEAK